MQVCTPELFHQATKSSRVKDVCAQIEDALERKHRGEIGQEDYDTMKTRLKSQLPILTPHATFAMADDSMPTPYPADSASTTKTTSPTLRDGGKQRAKN